jgi:hypothetical protein
MFNYGINEKYFIYIDIQIKIQSNTLNGDTAYRSQISRVQNKRIRFRQFKIVY